ncbi:MAG: hypothetical protein EB015_16000 [Methylocystaceae bacterium]|nr:hypothetical protein [Methylocystaceae bacterium]
MKNTKNERQKWQQRVEGATATLHASTHPLTTRQTRKYKQPLNNCYDTQTGFCAIGLRAMA